MTGRAPLHYYPADSPDSPEELAIEGVRAAEGTGIMSQFIERQIGDLTVRIDRATCIGSGNCIKVARELFELDSENVVTFKAGPPTLDRNQVIEACQVCPVDALIVLGPDSAQLIP